MTEEERLQQDMYLWFHNTYPELRGLLCYNFNNSKNEIEGSKNRSMGLQKGRSDLVFYYNSIASQIEVKTKTGSQSPHQKKWQRKIESQGFNYYIVRSVTEFEELIYKLMR